MNSKFNRDLSEEQKLGNFLDYNFYNNKAIFPNNFQIRRITDMTGQFDGIDIEILDTNTGTKSYIDEKGQSHYKNKNMPTFAFEISSLNKSKQWREGWLFDDKKITDQYILITCIEEVNGLIKSCRILLVDRCKLLNYLIQKNLNKDQCMRYEKKFRQENSMNKQKILELDSTEGHFFYTKHLSEEPINLVLYIKMMLREGICTELVPCRL